MIPDDHDLTVRHIQNWMKARGGGGSKEAKRYRHADIANNRWLLERENDVRDCKISAISA